jgi:hypothetical protein
MLFTLHVTELFDVPVTVATNCCVPSVCTLTVDGATDTWIAFVDKVTGGENAVPTSDVAGTLEYTTPLRRKNNSVP